MANRTIERLSARQAATITKPGRHADGGNLYLSISNEGWRRWTFLYRDRRTGRLREMGLGPAIGPKRAGLSLADARRKAAQARQLLYNGADPLADKKSAKEATDLARRQAKTFGEFADEFIDSIASGFRERRPSCPVAIDHGPIRGSFAPDGCQRHQDRRYSQSDPTHLGDQARDGVASSAAD